MPHGNRTGPQWTGPMTGRAAGYCAGYGVPGYMNPLGGRGLGLGRGCRFGHGFGRGFGPGRVGVGDFGYPPVGPAASPETKEQELDLLESQAKGFERALDDIRKRISELKAENE